MLVVLLGFLLIIIGAGGYFWLSRQKNETTLVSGGLEAGPSPEKVVTDFYDWYLGYEGNPLAQKAYQSRGEVSSELAQTVAETP